MLFGEHAKCQAEAEYPELWQGLVGAWSPCLSPRGGTVLRDLSGRGNHGTLINMDQATDWIVSEGYKTLDFDGINDGVHFGSFVMPPQFTINLWIRPDESTTVNACFCGNWNSSGWLFRSNTTDATKLEFFNGTETYTAAANTFVAAKLQMISCAYDGSYYSLFNNATNIYVSTAGRAGLTASGGDPANPESSSVHIGRVPYPGVNFKGRISDTTIWQYCMRDLSPLYRLGPGGWASVCKRRWNYVAASTNRRRRLLFSSR